MDLDLNLPEDGYGALPPAEPFPEMAAQRDSFLKSPSEVPEEDESESAEAAQVPKRRGRRALPLDTVTELRNSDLAQWNTDYVTNMEEAAHRKAQHKQVVQAKRNAAAWVFGNGLGGVGTGFAIPNLRNPLDMFAGDKLYEALTGSQINLAGRKRGRAAEEGETSESEERRTRPRSEDEEQVGRGEGLDLGNDDELPRFDDNVRCSSLRQITTG
jgi:meiotic recombination protein REC8